MYARLRGERQLHITLPSYIQKPFARNWYYRLRYHQPPLRPDSVGYTAAERRRLWWGRWVIRLFIWLLSGREAIGRLFRRSRRGRRSLSGHEKKKE